MYLILKAAAEVKAKAKAKAAVKADFDKLCQLSGQINDRLTMVSSTR